MGKPTMEDLREAFRSATRKARSKPPKWKTIKCERCGIEVSTMKGQTKYCRDCALIVKREQSSKSCERQRAYERRKNTQMETQETQGKEMKRKKKHESQITALVDAARKAGLSYGRYVAMMEMQKGA